MALQSNIPFIRNQAGGNLSNAPISPLRGHRAVDCVWRLTTVAAARTLQASIAINGQAANQQSVIAVGIGTADTLQSSGQPIINGQCAFLAIVFHRRTGAAELGDRWSPAAPATVFTAARDFRVCADQTAYNATGTGSGSSRRRSSVDGRGAAARVAPRHTVSPGGDTDQRTGRNRLQPHDPGLERQFRRAMTTTAQSTPYSVTGGVALTTDAPTNWGRRPSRYRAIAIERGQQPDNAVWRPQRHAGGRQAFVDDRTLPRSKARPARSRSMARTWWSTAANQAASLYR